MRSLSALILAILLFCTHIPSPAQAWFGNDPEPKPAHYSTLADMADAMAKEIREGHAGMGLKLYLDRDEVREDQEQRCVPFAGLVVDELERALSKVGYSFEGRNIDAADYIVTISYHRSASDVAVYLKLKSTKNDTYRNLKGIYKMPLANLPGQCFTETLDAKLGRMALKLSRGWNRPGNLSVAMIPIVEARKKYSSPFSEYATRKLKTALADMPYFRILEEKPVTTRAATRSISKEAPLAGADAVMAGADAVMEGVYLRGKDTVTLAVSLKDMKGAILGNGEETISPALIPFSLDNDAAESLALIADTEHETGGAVRISTVKGGSYQVFREGESVTFTLQVSRPLYVYMYDINPDGNVSLLYPKAGEAELPRQPGLIYTIPEASDSWEIKVEPPFGKDAVKVFASDRKLPVPVISKSVASRSFSGGTRALARVDKQKELAAQPAINGLDLVDYYKGLAAGSGAALYESTVFVETREAQSGFPEERNPGATRGGKH